MRTPEADAKISSSLSLERLQKYLIEAGGDLSSALSLYEKNTRLAEAFYTSLQGMEICFRNKINDALSREYGADWFQSNRVGLRSDTQQKIEAVINDLNNSRRPASPGRVVAELSFGFWVAFIGPRYDPLWRRALYKCFRATDERLARKRVHGRFNALRRFRNRVAHHEPIFDSDPLRIHFEILEATRWMCRDTADWLEHHSRLPSVFAEELDARAYPAV